MNSTQLMWQSIALPPELWASLGVMVALMLLLWLRLLRHHAVLPIAVLLVLGLGFFTPYTARRIMVPQPARVILAVDQSPSMQLGDRPEQVRRALAHLQSQLRQEDGLEVERHDLGNLAGDQTALFDALEAAIQRQDPRRIAAVILVTDGQIADVPRARAWRRYDFPLQVLLVGKPFEQQAWLEIKPTAGYGMVGDSLPVALRAHWPSMTHENTEAVLSLQHGPKAWQQTIPLNQWTSVRLPIDHMGRNAFTLALPNFDGAIFPASQTNTVSVMGILPRQPMLWMGNGTLPEWLRAAATDPLVDLRPLPARPEPLAPYSVLIADEMLTRADFSAWHDYVMGGGSLLVVQSSAPESPLPPEAQKLLPLLWDAAQIMPPSPLAANAKGLVHPITADLRLGDMQTSEGPRITANSAVNPHVLIEGQNGQAAMAAADIGQGRVVMITQPALLADAARQLMPRATAWLLRQSDINAEAIQWRLEDDGLHVEYLNVDGAIRALQITRPDRSVFELPITADHAGLNTAQFAPDQMGVYRISDGKTESAYVHGNILVPEWQAVAATTEKLAPLVRQSGGQFIWLSQTPMPETRWVTGRQGGGKDWIALRESRGMLIASETLSPLFPPAVLLCLMLGAITLGWWREQKA